MRRSIVAAILAVCSATSAASQDLEAGAKVFNQCRACHQVGETAKNAVGPKLNGLFGRKAGTIEGFTYSESNKNSGVEWNEAIFKEYIADPKKFMPGNKMIFAGLKREADVVNVTAFLKQFDKDGKKP